MSAEADIPELSISDQSEDIVALLRELQRAVLVHPEAARALFDAFAKEGRLFAQTAEGQRWSQRVLESELLERALLVWQSATLWTSDEPGNGATPTALIDAVASAARSPERDLLLERLFRGT